MSDICNSFERTCVEEFGFLVTDYGLKMAQVEKAAYGCYVTYNNEVVAVEVSYDIKDGGLFVMLCRMVNGKIPPQEVFIRSETLINRFDLEDVVSLKEPSIDLEQDFADPHKPTAKELRTNLKIYAEALKTYAKDILGGDFSSFADLEKIVKRRANVLKE